MRSRAVTFANFLRQPYPYYFTQDKLGKLALAICVPAFLFVYLFEPFNVNPEEHKMAYFWISFIHVAVSSLVLYGCYSLVNLLKIEEEKWTLGKEIAGLALVLLFMGIANFLIRDLFYDNHHNWSFRYLLEEVRNTFLVGILLVLLLVPLNFARIYSRNSGKAASFETPAKENNIPPRGGVEICTQVKSDDFSLQVEDFLFARAEGNYVEFYLTGEQNKKLLKRIAMKELEQQLSSFPQIIKTHRSYLVNLQKVTSVAGNAQGYQLSLEQFPSTVPVSRGMIHKFDKVFANPAL
ncbi:MAG: LytTR family DNA-binding domain-containing protein [Salinimicrobium sediminis]|nr:LytTR family DNA-binding domain-containing protein [Salinimicrobium sediminis]